MLWTVFLSVQESVQGFGVVAEEAACWGGGYVSSHCLMDKAWAPHTGDTKSAAGDALLGVCMQRPRLPQLPLPPPPVWSPQIWERNAASYKGFL